MISKSRELDSLFGAFEAPLIVLLCTCRYGTVVGAFINYAVMISIVEGKRDILVNTNGNASWSGATIQSYNTNATSWALAQYLYKSGKTYGLIPWGLLIGFGLVGIHRVIYKVSALQNLSHQTSLTFSTSSNPPLVVSKSPILTFLSSSSILATSLITKRRRASSSAGQSLVSSCNSIYDSIDPESSGTTRTL